MPYYDVFGKKWKNYFAEVKRYIWQLTCQDGEHTIKIDWPRDLKKPIDIWVDGRHIITVQIDLQQLPTTMSEDNQHISTTVLPNGLISSTAHFVGPAFWPRLEYPFECGGEQVLMVLGNSKIDLVYQGHLVQRGHEYLPDYCPPKQLVVRMMGICMASLLLFAIPLPWTTLQGTLIGLLCAAITSLITIGMMYTQTRTVFDSPKQKKRNLILITCVGWAFSLLSLIVFTVGFHFGYF